MRGMLQKLAATPVTLSDGFAEVSSYSTELWNSLLQDIMGTASGNGFRKGLIIRISGGQLHQELLNIVVWM